MKVTAKAPANIAFIKYWGKRDEKLRLPMNSSLSMNLSDIFTVTSVEFRQGLSQDFVKIDGKIIQGKEKGRIVEHLNRIRKLAKLEAKAKVISKNNFPKGTGLASSASGFAALTLAASKAAGLNLSQKELSVLARLGSGSACRSIPDGFVEWEAGNTSKSSYAYSLYPPDYWDICDVIVVVGETNKKVSSSEGHVLAESSPFFRARIAGMGRKIQEIKQAVEKKDFSKFGQIIEEEAINMHAVMMTSKPALYYWNPETLRVILKVIEWRDLGLEEYFTIDAGPNVHLVCQGKDAPRLKARLKEIKGVKGVIINYPAKGVHIAESMVLVDKNNKVLGYKEKYECHRNPVPLHRAISVVIFDKSQTKMLIHQRSAKKVTWPLFWTNPCCSHPFRGESYKAAAQRRLKEEMGFSTPLKEAFRFIYQARYDKTWGEHEFDVVFIGNYKGRINPNPEEVADYKWVDVKELLIDTKKNSHRYTPWFKIILERLKTSIKDSAAYSKLKKTVFALK